MFRDECIDWGFFSGWLEPWLGFKEFFLSGRLSEELTISCLSFELATLELKTPLLALEMFKDECFDWGFFSGWLEPWLRFKELFLSGWSIDELTIGCLSFEPGTLELETPLFALEMFRDKCIDWGFFSGWLEPWLEFKSSSYLDDLIRLASQFLFVLLKL